MKNPVRTAVVGLGNVGQNTHLPIIDRHQDTELVAICDTNKDRLRDFASEYGVTGYRHLETMLSEESLESVHVCTPPQTHAAIAEDIISNGIPVLIEKPVTTSVAELERLIEVSNMYDVSPCVVHNQLFFPCTSKTISRVKKGEIGDISSVTMLFSEPQDLTKTARGDWVFDLPGAELGEGIVHQIYLPLAFVDGLGGIKSITRQNFLGYDDPIDFDGLVIEAVDSTGERIITIKILTTTEYKNELLIHGTKGELRLDLLKRKAFSENKGTSLDATPAETLIVGSVYTLQQLATNLIEQAIGEVRRRIYDQFGHAKAMSQLGHYWLISEYAKSVRAGSQPPVTLEDALDTIEILEAVGSSE